MSFLVHSEAEIRPTEDAEKVKKAVTNILRGEVEVRQVDEWSGKVILDGKDQSSLERFRMILQRDRIRAAARSVLRRSVEGNRLVFYLNKQAAYAGHVSFSAPEGESPMGPIQVIVEAENPDQLIDWLAGQREERRRD
ncbi:MAG TPA: RNA-binding domain-containing protein [Candidatus Bathyarchaeia archaeon]